MDISSG